MSEGRAPPRGRTIGRYVLYDEIAAGGMASVHLARLIGPVGFARTVAIKRPHPHLSRQAEFVSMFVEEARLAARIRHPNVVPTTDVVVVEDEVLLVMEYVQGESLARITKELAAQGLRLPVPVALSVVTDALYGLHAAHEARDDTGQLLGLVHRDVSPHNIVVGRDGVARLVDFGVAKARSHAQSTTNGALKGKLAYMAPEQLMRLPIDPCTDVFSASVVLWEILTGKRLFAGDNEGDTLSRVLGEPIAPPSHYVTGLPPALDAVVLKGLARAPSERHETAQQMARAIEAAARPARHAEVGEWVEQAVGEVLRQRDSLIAEIERPLPAPAVAAAAQPSAPNPDENGSTQASGGGGETSQTVLLRDGPSSNRHDTVPDAASPGATGEVDAPPAEHPSIDAMATAIPSAGTVGKRFSSVGRRWLIAGIVLVAVVTPGILAASVARLRRTATSAPVDPVLPSASAPLSSVVNVAAAPATASPPEEAVSRAHPPSTAQGDRPRRRAAPLPSTPSSPSPSGLRDCHVPYYFDASGVKRFKPSCL